MRSDEAYTNLLKKMLTIELLGYNLYTVLSCKTHDKKRKSIYETLAIGEQQTAQLIKNQFLNDCQSNCAPNKALIASAQFVFKILSAKYLRSILAEKIYSAEFTKHRRSGFKKMLHQTNKDKSKQA